MRTLLLAGVAAFALLSTPAHADLPVIDPVAIGYLTQQVGLTEEQGFTLLQSLETARNVLNTALNTLQVTQQVYGEAMRIRANAEFIFNALSHPTSINQIAQALNVLRFTMPQINQLQATITGRGGFAGGGNWGGLAQQYQAANTVYLPPQTATDFAAQQLWKNSTYTANAQAMAHQNLQALQDRAASMPDVQTQIDIAPDQRAAAAVNGRLLAELNYTVSQQASAANLQVLSQAQHDAVQQAQQQGERQQLDGAQLSICSSLAGLGGAVSGSCAAPLANAGIAMPQNNGQAIPADGAAQCPAGQSPTWIGGVAGCGAAPVPAGPGIMSGLSQDPTLP